MRTALGGLPSYNASLGAQHPYLAWNGWQAEGLSTVSGKGPFVMGFRYENNLQSYRP